MLMILSWRSALRAAPDQVCAPLPVVEKTPVTSGLACRMRDGLGLGAGRLEAFQLGVEQP